jgi:site-specific DNA-methyltransferase (adenine-specific)
MNYIAKLEGKVPAAVASWLDDPNDATKDGAQRLRRANENLRTARWPEPFDRTTHTVRCGDARRMDFIQSGSVHLVVTSPPYWTLKDYETSGQQIGSLADYDAFLIELRQALSEISRVLVQGGRACINVGDVCLSRKDYGRHLIMPLHADIQVMARDVGLDCLTPIIWQKIANGKNESVRAGSGFYGKPYQPGAVIKNDVEYILFLRKPGGYRNPSPLQKALSLLDECEMKKWFRSVWSDLKGASTRQGHPAPFPIALADRLIRMFSFAGDMVLDPFAGSGTTGVAAVRAGRNSYQVEIGRRYIDLAQERIQREIANAQHATCELEVIV